MVRSLSWVGALGLLCLFGLTACRDLDRTVLSDSNLRLTPNELAFGQVPMFAGKELKLTASNAGRNQVQIQKFYFEGMEAMELSGLPEGGKVVLASGARSELRVRFRPRREGAQTGFLVLETDSTRAPVIRIPMSGEGVDARAGVDGSELDFGRIEVGTQKTVSFPVTNPSAVQIKVVPRWVGADRDEFSGQPVNLAPGESRGVDLTFSPSRVGVKKVALALSRCEGCEDALVSVKAIGLDRAVVAEPPIVDFGQVPIDLSKTLKARVRNISTEPMVVPGVVLLSGGDPGYTKPGNFAGTLAPNAVGEVDVRFGPTHLGGALGKVAFNVVSRRNPRTEITLNGFGGSPELCVSPTSIDFGTVPVGAKLSKVISVSNCGSPNGAPLQLLEARLDQNGGVSPTPFAMTGLTVPQSFGAGQGTTFKIIYEPGVAGTGNAILTLRTVGGQDQTITLPVTGNAQVYPPCTLSVTPTSLNFGNVSPNNVGVLGVRIENKGRDLCAVKNLRLSNDGNGAYSLPGGEVDGLVLGAGDAFSVQVAFTPRVSGVNIQGMFQVGLSNPADPLRQVPLTGNAQNTCVVAIPPFLDFGAALPQCRPSPRSVDIKNNCADPVTVNSIFIGSGTSDGEFFFTTPPPGPVTLVPGAAARATVNYGATVYGQSYAPLYAQIQGLAQPVLVSLLGEFSPRGSQTDRFVQTDGSRVDVLFVVNNTASMAEEQPKLQSAIPSFVSAAQAKNVDLHVAVTTTGIQPAPGCSAPGGANGGEAGRFFPADNSAPRVLTNATPGLAAQLQSNADVGLCHPLETALEAMQLALSAPLINEVDDPTTALANDGNAGFLRSEAGLAVVFVDDEDDHSPDSVESYVDFLRQVKGVNQAQRASIYALAPIEACATAGGVGPRFGEAARSSGGEAVSICAPDYAPLLQTVASRVFNPQDRFTLTRTPEPGTISVTVNGARVTSGWTYDAGTNSIVFSPIAAAGANITVTYSRACTN